MTQSPDQQQPPESSTPQEQFYDLIDQEPYKGYMEQYQETILNEAKGDPAIVEKMKWDFLRRMIGNFPPLKDAYDQAFPQAQQQDEQGK